MSPRAVLAIDTAGPLIGVAVASDTHPLLSWDQRVVRGADAVLLPAVARMLGALDARGDHLVGVAVSVGPGAFTGLRVGLAAALGVAVSRRVPVHPLGSLEARALLTPKRPLLSLLDARKQRFYGQRFGPDGALGEAVDQPLSQLLARTPPGAVVVGEGALVSADALAEHGLVPLARADAVPAPELAQAALDGLIPPVDAAAVQLRYVRPPDAKRPTHLLVPPGAPS